MLLDLRMPSQPRNAGNVGEFLLSEKGNEGIEGCEGTLPITMGALMTCAGATVM